MTEGVKPLFDELERFQESADDLQRELNKKVTVTDRPTFSPGDNVEVIEGELLSLRGRVQNVIDGVRVMIMPIHEDLKEPLTLNASELRKYFAQGDHVRIIEGRYEGNTGTILKVLHKIDGTLLGEDENRRNFPRETRFTPSLICLMGRVIKHMTVINYKSHGYERK